MEHAYTYYTAPGPKKRDPWVYGLPGKGPIPADYMIIGLAPSTKRPKNRKLEPFGSTSWDLVQTLRQNYPGIYVTNLVKEPLEPGKKAGKRLIERWMPAIQTEIELVDPSRILLLGDQVARALLPGFDSLREDHGTLFMYKDRIWVPTYHFTAARRSPEFRPFLQRDLQRFFELPDPELPEYVMVQDPASITIPRGCQVVLDIETTGLTDQDHITLLGIRLPPKRRKEPINYVIPTPTSEQLTQLSELFVERGVTLLGHNLVFDISFLLKETKGGWRTDIPIRDTMSLAYAEGHPVLALKHLTSTLTDLPGSRFASLTQDPTYLAGDLISTEAVDVALRGKRPVPYVYQLLCDLAPRIAEMKYRGVHIESETLGEIGVWARENLQESLATLESLANIPHGSINFASSQQVIALLEDCGVPLEKNRNGNPSAAEKVLLPLQEKYPIVGALLAYRAASKLVTGFVEPYQRLLATDPYLHPTMMIHSTRTGRLSCRNPNLQQVPRVGPLKRAFTPRWKDGQIGLIDFSQAELRIAALISGDQEFIKALLGPDVHRYIASICFQKKEEEVSATERKASKKITFGVLYGGTPAGLADRAGLPVQRVEKVVKVFFSHFPGLAKWFEGQRYAAIMDQEVTTAFGRVRDLRPELLREGPNGAYRKAVNTPVQSLASDCMLVVLRRVLELIEENNLHSYPLFGVHDSLLLEIYPGEEDLVEEFVQEGFRALWKTPISDLPDWPKLPLTGEFLLGPSWASVESTNEAYAPARATPCSSH